MTELDPAKQWVEIGPLSEVESGDMWNIVFAIIYRARQWVLGAGGSFSWTRPTFPTPGIFTGSLSGDFEVETGVDFRTPLTAERATNYTPTRPEWDSANPGEAWLPWNNPQYLQIESDSPPPATGQSIMQVNGVCSGTAVEGPTGGPPGGWNYTFDEGSFSGGFSASFPQVGEQGIELVLLKPSPEAPGVVWMAFKFYIIISGNSGFPTSVTPEEGSNPFFSMSGYGLATSDPTGAEEAGECAFIVPRVNGVAGESVWTFPLYQLPARGTANHLADLSGLTVGLTIASNFPFGYDPENPNEEDGMPTTVDAIYNATTGELVPGKTPFVKMDGSPAPKAVPWVD